MENLLGETVAKDGQFKDINFWQNKKFLL
jgi:hypothetical protein